MGIKKSYRRSHGATDPTTKPEFESELHANRLNNKRRRKLNEWAKQETRHDRHTAKTDLKKEVRP